MKENLKSIVSIQTSNTEILFALGLGDKMIGVSDYCNYPEEALEIQKVGGQDMDAELGSLSSSRYGFCDGLSLQNSCGNLKTV